MIISNPYGFIYITTNLANGKRYIGQRKFSNGWKGYLGSGKHLKEAVKKYGRNMFSRNIISIAYSQEELNKQEKEIIGYLNANNSRDFYNISEGGCVKGKAGENAFWYGKKIPLISILKANKKRNKPVYQFSLNGELIGEYISITAAALANNLCKQNIAIACKDEAKTAGGYFWSLNQNRNVFSNHKNDYKTKTVYQYDKLGNFIKEFNSVKEAASYYGIDPQRIYRCCIGKTCSAMGFTWSYSR